MAQEKDVSDSADSAKTPTSEEDLSMKPMSPADRLAWLKEKYPALFPRKQLDEASDPNTPPERLRELSDWGHTIAKNPSTPIDVLIQLAEKYPAAIAENPIWDLLLLENPNFLQEYLPFQLRFLGEEETSPKLLLGAQHHPSLEVKLFLTKNLSCPPDILLTLIAHPELHRDIAQNPNCPEFPARVAFLIAKDEKVRAALARNPSCTEQELTALSRDESSKVRATAARHPRCPPEELSRLARDEERRAKLAVAERPDCPVELMKALAADRWDNVRFQIVRKRNCPPEILALFAKDSDRIKRLLVNHPNCPTEALAVLLRDTTHDIRLRARKHKNAPKEIIALLQDLPNITREQYILLVNEHYLSNREARLHPMHAHALPIRFIPWHSRFNRGRPREETNKNLREG